MAPAGEAPDMCSTAAALITLAAFGATAVE
jgi:hypothetical protein